MGINKLWESTGSALLSWPLWAGIMKYPQTGWLSNGRNLFLTVLQVRESMIQVLAARVSGESCFLFLGDFLFTVSLYGRGVKGALSGLALGM